MSARSVLLISCIAALAACARGDEARPADSAAASAAPTVVSLTATDYAIAAPDSIAGGWTTFRLANRGEQVHYGHIVALDSGRTVQDLLGAYLEAIRTSGPRPTWVKRFGGPGGTAPGDSSNVTQYLEAGSYVWICPVEDSTGTPHFAKGEVKPFVVLAAAPGTPGPDAAPAAGAVIRLVDHAFTIASPLRPGQHTIRVENAGAEPHDFGLLKLAPGTTIEDVQVWLNPERARRTDKGGEPPPLEAIGSVAGGIAAIAPGMSAYFETNLTPGEYVLFCMVTAPDGRSHIEHGMIQQLRVD
ncbi:MAG: hypothetical protein K0S86_3033 [Geminicoccaceae bacterium]|nr:hypothetical protein [Geminicoccaceae bacterium]